MCARAHAHTHMNAHGYRYVCVCTYYGMFAKVSGQLLAASSLLLPCDLGSNPGHPFYLGKYFYVLSRPSLQPKFCFSKVIIVRCVSAFLLSLCSEQMTFWVIPGTQVSLGWTAYSSSSMFPADMSPGVDFPPNGSQQPNVAEASLVFPGQAVHPCKMWSRLLFFGFFCFVLVFVHLFV